MALRAKKRTYNRSVSPVTTDFKDSQKMTVTNSQLPLVTANSGSISQRVPVGYDGGFGFSKLCLEAAEIKLSSYLATANNPNEYSPNREEGACIQYLDGTREDMLGQRWLAGSVAYQEFPESYLRVADDRRGKIAYGLQMLLGAIACLPWRPVWDFELLVSIQDSQALGGELVAALGGNHTILINGRHQSQINIRATATEEGIGAIAYAASSGICKATEQIIQIDVGFGTLISSVYRDGKLIAKSRRVLSGGVDALINAIARNLETRKHWASDGDKELLRRGIESQLSPFQYGTTGWNFEGIYLAELRPWIESNLAQALKAVEPWKADAAAVLVVGGGAQLPFVGEALMKRGYLVVGDSQWCNARGLLKLAQIKNRRAA